MSCLFVIKSRTKKKIRDYWHLCLDRTKKGQWKDKGASSGQRQPSHQGTKQRRINFIEECYRAFVITAKELYCSGLKGRYFRN